MPVSGRDDSRGLIPNGCQLVWPKSQLGHVPRLEWRPLMVIIVSPGGEHRLGLRGPLPRYLQAAHGSVGTHR